MHNSYYIFRFTLIIFKMMNNTLPINCSLSYIYIYAEIYYRIMAGQWNNMTFGDFDLQLHPCHVALLPYAEFGDALYVIEDNRNVLQDFWNFNV